MTVLLDLYDPDTVGLVAEIRTLVQPALLALQPGQPTHLGLLRVSDESRRKFQTNLDTDLDWLTYAPEAAWVKAHVTDVEAFRATPAGERMRTTLGMRPL